MIFQFGEYVKAVKGFYQGQWGMVVGVEKGIFTTRYLVKIGVNDRYLKRLTDVVVPIDAGDLVIS